MSLARVFPRRTALTPDDEMAFVGNPPLWLDQVDEVHVSCAFTWDRERAERLRCAWSYRFPSATVVLGGPAFGDSGRAFVPGLYLARGAVITSRGCPNRCPMCFVPRREGGLRTLPIADGWNVLDNNLLACPEPHIQAVLAMLARQTEKARFTGGFEAWRFTRELGREILSIKPNRMYFAYDRPGQIEDVRNAVAIIRELTGWKAGTLRHHVGCYVLVGYPGDEVSLAEQRVQKVIDLNIRAYPMFYRGESYTCRPPEWHDLIGGLMAMRRTR